MRWRHGRDPLVEAGRAPFGKTCSWRVGLGSRMSYCVLARGHDGPHRGMCGVEAAGPAGVRCLLPRGHDGPHQSTSRIAWTDADDETAEGQAALDLLIGAGLLAEEQSDGRVRLVTPWRPLDGSVPYEALQHLVDVASEAIGAVRAAVEDGHPGFGIVSDAVRLWDEAMAAPVITRADAGAEQEPRRGA